MGTKPRGDSAPKQMGPASLPTPLSPMRGPVRRQALGIRCFAVMLRQGAAIGVCHRRSHRHPAQPSSGLFAARPGRSHRFASVMLAISGPYRDHSSDPASKRRPLRLARKPHAVMRIVLAVRPAHDRDHFTPPSSSLDPWPRPWIEFLGPRGDRSRHAIPDRILIIDQARRPSVPKSIRSVPMDRLCAKRGDSPSWQDRAYPPSPIFSVDGG